MIKVRKLNCGSTLIMEKTDFFNSAALGIWVKSGSAYENDEISGISHFIEHMMFKGTSTRSAKELAEAVDRIGGSFNAFTGKESTCYYIKTLSSNICKGAEILLDMVTDSVLDPEELNKERNVICEEIKMVKDTPDEEAYDRIMELVHSGNPLRRNILGTPKSLEKISSETMREYMAKRYVREGIVISVAGNFDEDELAELFERRLTVLGDRLDEKPFVFNPYSQHIEVIKKDIEQTHICLGIPSVSMVDDMYYSFVIMNNIFGGGMSSRLFQNIREEKGLAYSISSMNGFSSNCGMYGIYMGVAHENVKEAIDAVKYELKNLVENGVTEDEMAMAKEQIKSSYIFGLESINSRMISLGRQQLLINRYFTSDEMLEGFDSVTIEDVAGAAAMIGDFSSYCGVAVTGKDIDLEDMIKNVH